MKRSLAIRWHLTIFGILSILPFLVVGFVISVQYVSAERDRDRRTAQDLVQTVTAALDAELERYRLALWVLSTSQSLADSNIPAFYAQAKKIADEMPGVVIALRELNGQPLFLTSLPFGASLKPNSDGVLLDADREAISSGRTIVSNVFRGGTTAALFISVDQPLVKDGRVVGLLNIGIPPIRFQTVLMNQVKTGWLFGVTDNSGRLVARTWEFERFVGKRATQSFLDRTSASGGDFTNISLDGVSVYNVWQRSSLTGWRMSVGIPTAELEAPIRQSIMTLITFAAGGILVSLLLAKIYGGRLVRRIKALELYATAISQPEPVDPLAMTGITELDAVLRALTEAAAALRKHLRIQASLIDELNHRVKNTLAIIQSIARQTRKRSSSLEDFGSTFEGRLMALASSHDALTRSGWRGGDLQEIVHAACRPFADADRIQTEGRPVELRSDAVVSTAMVLHELATNAAKYGALSVSTGWLSISWRVDRNGGGDVLRFEWKEHDGPPLGRFEKKGFGSVLITSLIEHDLQGKATFVPEVDGLRFSATFSLGEADGQRADELMEPGPPL